VLILVIRWLLHFASACCTLARCSDKKTIMTIQPLDEVPVNSLIASLPKADLHLHQEEVARLERVVARRQGRPRHNWRESARRLIAETPPGESCLASIYSPDADLDLGGVPADEPEYIIAKIADALEESAADGAVLVEIRFGAGGLALMRPDFMALFRGMVHFPAELG
jgi:hypothetical protein